MLLFKNNTNSWKWVCWSTLPQDIIYAQGDSIDIVFSIFHVFLTTVGFVYKIQKAKLKLKSYKFYIGTLNLLS